MAKFKLTYASMFETPDEVHTRYDAAVSKVKANLGKTFGMIINNQDHFTSATFENRSPINTDWVLAHLPEGTVADAMLALGAARTAFPAWSSVDWKDRVALVRRAADIVEERMYELAAATTLNVGKNRLESLGDIQEGAELLRAACDSMEKNNGYVLPMASEPLPGHSVLNFSVMKPYGVWLIISPFNFPVSLTCGPAGAALVSGNTVVTKPSVETAWVVRLLAECFRDAGFPDGLFNYVTGKNDPLAQALVDSPHWDGITFTGSYRVGMKIYREAAKFTYPRPVILEMGGKSAAVVSRHADLERAAWGIVRSGFGAQGQKCSASSRVYAETSIYDELVGRVTEITKSLKVGDPTERDVYLGPVVRESSYRNFSEYCSDLSKAGKITAGGHTITNGAFARGFYCEPTIYTDVPRGHRLWKHEMFVPLVMIDPVDNLDEAFALANDVEYGLAGGFYGTQEEAQNYFRQIQVGVVYVNRAQGASTGAWPGYQSFGGWKASGASGKGSGGPYYLLSYMHEQSQTIVA
ncbi:MAG: aldehyde dehydrogenase family protein [Candidatus Acidiferrales bacterium]